MVTHERSWQGFKAECRGPAGAREGQGQTERLGVVSDGMQWCFPLHRAWGSSAYSCILRAPRLHLSVSDFLEGPSLMSTAK